jgi:hypothetical protein
MNSGMVRAYLEAREGGQSSQASHQLQELTPLHNSRPSAVHIRPADAQTLQLLQLSQVVPAADCRPDRLIRQADIL